MISWRAAFVTLPATAPDPGTDPGEVVAAVGEQDSAQPFGAEPVAPGVDEGEPVTRRGVMDQLFRGLTGALRALEDGRSSVRLRAALAVGTAPDARFVDKLVERCAIEPEFFVRDMLTWALVRHRCP